MNPATNHPVTNNLTINPDLAVHYVALMPPTKLKRIDIVGVNGRSPLHIGAFTVFDQLCKCVLAY